MTLHQLRLFLAVAELRSVRAAAERLYVSQPAISAAVSSLERELGVALLEAAGRGIRLTRAGDLLAVGIREGLESIDHAARIAQEVEKPESGVVRIASIGTAAEQLLLPLLGGFRLAYPDASVTVEVGNRSMVWQALAGLSVDLVVAGRPPGSIDARVVGVAPNRLVLVGPPAVAVRRRGLVGTLGGMSWLLREEGSGTREATEELLDSLGIDPPRMVLGSNGAVLEAVCAGFGVALLAQMSVRDAFSTRGIVSIPCPGTPMERPWHLAARADRQLSPTARLAVQSLLAQDDGFQPTGEGARVLESSSA